MSSAQFFGQITFVSRNLYLETQHGVWRCLILPSPLTHRLDDLVFGIISLTWLVSSKWVWMSFGFHEKKVICQRKCVHFFIINKKVSRICDKQTQVCDVFFSRNLCSDINGKTHFNQYVLHCLTSVVSWVQAVVQEYEFVFKLELFLKMSAHIHSEDNTCFPEASPFPTELLLHPWWS